MRPPLQVFAPLAAMALGGCYGMSASEIRVDDTAVIPSARMAYDISRPRGSPSEPHSGHAIELGATRAHGSASQSLNPGDAPIVLGREAFAAPQKLRYTYDYAFYELAYRWRRFFREGRFGIEALGGLGRSDLRLTASSSTQRASDRRTENGFVAGVGALWRFRPGLSLQSRLALWGPSSTESLVGVTRFEVQAVQALGRHAALRGGVAWSSVKFGEEDQGPRDSRGVNTVSTSQVNLRFWGPALGLEVMF